MFENNFFSITTSFGESLNNSDCSEEKSLNSQVLHLFSPKFKILNQNILFVLLIDIIFEFDVSYFSHSNQIVAGVITLTISLFTIHFKFGSLICSAIAILYHASISIGRYFSFA